MQIPDVTLIEQFLLSPNPQQFIDTLYYFDKDWFQILQNINGKDTLTKDELNQLKEFKKKYGNQPKHQNYTHVFELKSLLKEYFGAQTQGERKKEILETLKEFYIQFHHGTHYSKPSNVEQKNGEGKSNRIYKAEMDQSIIDPQKIINDIFTHQRYSSISQINFNYLTKVDITELKGNNTYNYFQSYLSRCDLQSLGGKIVDVIKDYIQSYKETHKTSNSPGLTRDILTRMTLDQILAVGRQFSHIENQYEWVDCVFKKLFGQELAKYANKNLSDLSNQQKIAKRALFVRIIEWCGKQLSKYHIQMQEQLQYEVMCIDRELEQFKEEDLVRYLEHPSMRNSSQLRWATKHWEKVYKSFESSTIYYNGQYQKLHLCTGWPADFELIESYLVFIFRQGGLQDQFKRFTKYLDEHYLTELYYKTQLQNGQALPNMEKLLGEHVIKALQSSREITICRSNERFFRAGEPVSLLVDIKNIQNLQVKCYEINTENYYLKNPGPFDNSMSLEGINPEEQPLEYCPSENAMQVKRHQFTFERLDRQSRGVFVIEFMGNGISSRAVVRRGGLSYLEQKTISGHLLTLISEDNAVCVPGDQSQPESSTGVWLSGRFLRANAQGQIVIPYGQNERQETLILVHQGFADLSSLRILREVYEFRAAYLYNQEAFLRGNKARIVLQPRLYINGLPTNLKVLEDFQVNVTLFNELGIPSNLQFRNLRLTHLEDLELEVPVQNLVSRLTVQVSARIKKLDGSGYQPVSHDHEIRFNLYEGVYQFVNLFLQQSAQSGYAVYLLGKNGEPYEDKIIDLVLTPDFQTSTITTTLQTDKDGKVVLGRLPRIVTVQASMRATVDIPSVTRTWTIQNKSAVDYPTLISLIQGDRIDLPSAQGSEVSKHTYSLCRKYTDQVIKDHLENITYGKERIQIKDLPEGDYVLLIKGSVQQKVDIQVIRGAYWEKNPLYIVERETSRFVLAQSVLSQGIGISAQLRVTPGSTSDLKNLFVGISLPEGTAGSENLRSMIRAHVVGYNYCSGDANDWASRLQVVKRTQSIQSSEFSSKKSVYLNNKQLGDEICYVYERKSQKKFVGNTLEKPGILLKRTFVRDTNFDKEDLNADRDFKDGLNDRIQQLQAEVRSQEVVARSANVQQVVQDSMLNFLRNPALILTNLKIQGDSEILIPDFPVQKYSSIQVVVTNLQANISRTFELDDFKATSFNDQRNVSQLQKDLDYCEKRKFIGLQKGHKKISILSDCESVIIDNLGQFFDIQKELRVAQHGSDGENGGYRFWDFLKTWNILTEEEKLRKYDEYACHEINVFLYFKDRTFHDKVVRPFLLNKIEKTFIDLFLIGDLERIKSLYFNNLERVTRLNFMEQNLLLIALLRLSEESKDPRFRQYGAYIATYMDQKVKGEQNNLEVRKQLFDTVITAKAKSEGHKKIKQIQQVQQQLQSRSRVQQSEMAVNLMDFHEELSVPMSYQAQSSIQPSHRMMKKSAAPQMKMMAMESRSLNFRRSAMKEEESMADEDCEQLDMLAEGRADMEFAAFGDPFADQMIQQRDQYKPSYQKLKQTKEYVERTYYNMKNPQDSTTLIGLNGFWSDLANHLITTGSVENFLTENWTISNSNHAEMISVLAFIDLDFAGGQYQLEGLEGRRIQITSGRDQNCIIFMKQIGQAEAEKVGQIAVTQRYFDPSNRYTYLEDDTSVQIEKDVDEFLVQKVYGCQAIITNCSVANLQFQILFEIPEGSIPVNGLSYTKTNDLHLSSYTTNKFEFYFYFPQKGSYGIYPVSVSRNEKVLATAQKLEPIELRTERTIRKLETFYDILNNGNQDDIIAFMEKKNIQNPKLFQITDIYWLLVSDSKFCRRVVDVLRKKGFYDNVIWEQGVRNGFTDCFDEYISRARFCYQFKYLESANYRFDSSRLFEYHPLLSNRVHNFMNQKKSKILNIEFKQTYEEFLRYLIEVYPRVTSEHYLVWCYYLLLQERIDESIQQFSKIDASKVSSRIQYEYLRAYLDIYTGAPNFAIARQVTKQYLDYPVISWRNLFLDLQNQLTEYDGDKVSAEDQVKETEINKNLKSAEKEENLNVELNKQTISLFHQNVDEVTLNFYELDLEVLFSRQPFLKQNQDQFSYVKANFSEKLKLGKKALLETHNYQIPEILANKNLYIQIKSSSNVQSLNYFSTQMKIQVLENYGQVKVLDKNNCPLSKVYVKAFALEKSGSQVFYRDGYTDMRGRFDYAMCSSGNIDQIQKFAILICSDDYGSMIKEAKTPSQISTMNQTLDF